MRILEGKESPRRLMALFFCVMTVLVAAMGWLGWRLLEQDRAVQSQRLQENLENYAELAAAAMVRDLAETEGRLLHVLSVAATELGSAAAALAREIGEDAAVVVFTQRGVDVYPDSRLSYYPMVPNVVDGAAVPDSEDVIDAYGRGEALEFRGRDPDAAATAFQQLAAASEGPVRAGALLRLGRSLRKAGRLEEALAAYAELAGSRDVSIGGVPADLVARHARCQTLARLERPAALQAEATALYADLLNGSWRLDRATYLFHVAEVRNLLGHEETSGAGEPTAPAPSADASSSAEVPWDTRMAFASTVEDLWARWQQGRDSGQLSAGRSSLRSEERPVFLVWRGTGDRLVALLSGPRAVEARVANATASIAARGGFEARLADPAGFWIDSGVAEEATARAVRTAAETGLPWTLHVTAVEAGAGGEPPGGRRSLLFAGLAMVVLFVLAGSYFIGRAVTREVEVARLQSDFVAAVSHEFRSPLTTLRHLTEMLAADRVASPERRHHYYGVMLRESGRLHRLVEGLLDFARMEGNGGGYRTEKLDMEALCRQVAGEFQQEVGDRGYRVETSLEVARSSVAGDREALSRALWNLLDNAVKYSPHCKTVWLDATEADGGLSVRVRDRGMGIAPADRERIFQKFVRGEESESSVRGTGMGLAMVRQIVEAHGGRVGLESEPGTGSTFSLWLPAGG